MSIETHPQTATRLSQSHPLFPFDRVPELRRAILAPGRQYLIVGTEGDIQDVAFVPRERRAEQSTRHIPQSDRAIITAGSQECTARGKSDGIDAFVMTLKV